MRALRRLVGACLLLALSLPALALDLTVSAAASLTNAFRELGPAFEAKYPGMTVVFNFAASDALLTQIAKGAPVDVYASADPETMDRADAQKLLVPGSRRDFGVNMLVLVVPIHSTLRVQALADLAGAAVKRVAIGSPASVPAGRYAKGVLDAAGLWSAVEPKAIRAQNVRQALDYVARGEVDAGFVYATDAAVQKDKVRVALTVPTATRITYPLAAVAGTPNVDSARRFVDFVLSAPAQAILARHGFTKL